MNAIKALVVLIMMGLAGGLIIASPVDAQNNFAATLIGLQQVPTISTTARGTFTATVAAGAINYRLTYTGLQGQARVAHIHFGQRGVDGGQLAILCTNLANAPTIPPYPMAGGTVTGTITPDHILPILGQGIAAGDFADAVRAMRAGLTYVNVHSLLFLSGELRGQIRGVPGP